MRRALGRSSVLVLVASPAALESDNVIGEIESFSQRRHPIVPIDLAGCVETLPHDHRLYSFLEERIRIAEPLASGGTMAIGPSDAVIKFLDSAFRFTRVGRIRTLILVATIAFFAMLTALLAVLFVLERIAEEQARRSEQTAITEREKTERAFTASGTAAIELLQTVVNNYSEWVPADSAISQAVIDKSQELVTKFVKNDATTGFVNLKGIGYLALSSLMNKKGNLEEAKKYAEQAVFWASEASKIVPDASELFVLHVTSLSELAEINLKMNDTAEFLANYNAALKVLRDTLAANHFVKEAKSELSATYRKYTQSLIRAHRNDDAEKALTEWVTLLDEMASADADSRDILNDLAEAHLRLFALFSRLERTDSNYERMVGYGTLALTYLKRLAQKEELKPDHQRYLTQLQSILADRTSEQGK